MLERLTGPRPAFLNNTPGLRNPVFASAALARGALAELARATLAELDTPARELEAERLTIAGAQAQRRAIAERALARLEGPVTAKVKKAEGEAEAARANATRAARDAEAKLPASVVARAAATARLVADVNPADAPSRERLAKFAEDVRAGVEDAVLAALQLSSYGPHAELQRVAVERFADAQFVPTARGDVRRLEVAARIVRFELDELRASLAAMARTGEQPPMTARALLATSNDADRVQVLAEAERLGVVEPSTASIGSAPTPRGSDRTAAGLFALANGGAQP